MTRVLFILIVLILSLGASYLLLRQNIYSDVTNGHHRVLDFEVAHLDKLSQEISRSLRVLGDSPVFGQLLAALNSEDNREEFIARRKIENLFLQVSYSKQPLISSIRFISSEGKEQFLVEQGSVVDSAANRINDEFFKRTITQSANKDGHISIETIAARTVLQRSAPVIVNGIVAGVINFTIELEEILLQLGLWKKTGFLSDIHIFNDRSRVVSVRHSNSSKSSVKRLEDIFKRMRESSLQTPVIQIDRSVWSYLKEPGFNIYVMFETSEQALIEKLHGRFTQFALVIIVSSFLLLILGRISRKTQKKIRTTREISAPNVTAMRIKDLAKFGQEIRVPLKNTLGILGALKEQSVDKPQSEMLVQALHSSELMHELVNEFIDYSKLTSGDLSLQNIDFNLRHTLTDVAEMMEVQAQSKQLEFGYLVSSKVPERVNGDPTRLRQVLLNLVVNAIKFTQRGDVAVAVSLLDLDKNRATIKFEISDTGIGIDPALQETIFNEFNTGDTEFSSVHSGAGLGLTISKKLVEAMGGAIGVEENASSGATFWFTIPFAAVTSAVEKKSNNDMLGVYMLLVSETESNRINIQKVIERWGIACVATNQFDEVLKILHDAHSADINIAGCLIDISLSSSSEKAFKLVSDIYAEHGRDKYATLILTAKGSPGEGIKARELGVMAYLTKPISRSQLKNAMQKVIDNRSLTVAPMVTRHTLKETEQADKQKVLIIEENIRNQKMLSSFLTKLGCDSDIAENGIEALAAIKNKNYKMILLDCKKTSKDITKTVKQIRKLESKVKNEMIIHIPIVALVPSDSENIKAQCREAGLEDQLIKPVNLKTLEQVLVDKGVLNA